MVDPHGGEPEEGATVELALSATIGAAAAVRGDLRGYLPGLEPERRVTDWGRSERIEALLDRTVSKFLYRYWFRAEIDGTENVPSEGGALLVANRGGVGPTGWAMIARAIGEEHPHPRPVHLLTGQSVQGVPGLGMLARKLGAVADHPANVHRLLFDERQLVLAFPEPPDGAGKALPDRYRVQPFGDGAFVDAAVRARVPIVPIAVLGAEEAVPRFARIDPLRRLRLPPVPVSTGIPLPAKFRIRFLEPVPTIDLGRPGTDRAAVQVLAQDIRSLIQENLLEMVAGRHSVWLG
jgi:1-acyl-sn-glycerol-3-phosphate acyltransferase